MYGRKPKGMRMPAGVTGTAFGIRHSNSRISITARSVTAQFSLTLKKLVLGLGFMIRIMFSALLLL